MLKNVVSKVKLKAFLFEKYAMQISNDVIGICIQEVNTYKDKNYTILDKTTCLIRLYVPNNGLLSLNKMGLKIMDESFKYIKFGDLWIPKEDLHTEQFEKLT